MCWFSCYPSSDDRAKFEEKGRRLNHESSSGSHEFTIVCANQLVFVNIFLLGTKSLTDQRLQQKQTKKPRAKFPGHPIFTTKDHKLNHNKMTYIER